MDAKTKAYLYQEGGKLVGDVIRMLMGSSVRRRSSVPSPERNETEVLKPSSRARPQAAVIEGEGYTISTRPSEPAPPSPTAVVHPSTSQNKNIIRKGVDADRLAWQDSLIRGELWLLEGHLKNNCKGCGGDVECCWKHCQNVIDSVLETQSMTTDPLYDRALTIARQVQPLVHPDDVKTGKHVDKYPGFRIAVSEVRLEYEKRVMAAVRKPLSMEEAKALAAAEAEKEVERRWHSQEKI
jgi:hypothetical protein